MHLFSLRSLRYCRNIVVALSLMGSSLSSIAQFRVVGYIHATRAIPDLGKINFQRITHLNIAFVNPDSTGDLVLPVGIDSIIRTAHRYGVKVLASIGGGSHNPYYANLLTSDNRPSLVEKLVKLTREHQLDGLDVDLENDVIDYNYGALIKDLAEKLKPLNKLLTAALATWNAEKIPDVSLNEFDFINVMSYDQTGPWRPDKPGPHSTYEKAVEDLRYWKVSRKVAAGRINLGLPFYGYCFGTTYGEHMSFGDIVENFRGSEKKDVVTPPGGGFIYYNGVPTIRKKTRLALEQAGGVMIWQLLQDDPGKHSLLKEIDNIRKKAGK